MKVHFLKNSYNSNYRGQLFPLLKAFIKSPSFTDQERKAMYQISEKEVEFVDDLKEAEICILTMSWNYYLETHQYDLAVDYIHKANTAGKQVWTWMSGDFGVKLNLDANFIVFRNSGHRSQLPDFHKGMPVFISDPLQTYFNSTRFIEPVFYKKPVVSFCGQANASLKQTFFELGIRLKHFLSFKFGKTLNEPQPIKSTSLLRANLLNRMERCEEIKTNFIKRKKYRAGVTQQKKQHNTTKEFYQNILDSQYVLCVRGGGNFSVRFYETLAMGRIPVFINTDCLLPLAGQINWKAHCVWIEENEKDLIAEKLINFHENHTEKSLLQMMKKNRELWKTQFRIGNFFNSNIT
jgi:hypothetical protein